VMLENGFYSSIENGGRGAARFLIGIISLQI
jgi:hypothetical protein